MLNLINFKLAHPKLHLGWLCCILLVFEAASVESGRQTQELPKESGNLVEEHRKLNQT